MIACSPHVRRGGPHPLSQAAVFATLEAIQARLFPELCSAAQREPAPEVRRLLDLITTEIAGEAYYLGLRHGAAGLVAPEQFRAWLRPLLEEFPEAEPYFPDEDHGPLERQ